jgi:uncharacterized protein YfiM (DUF2279 family)
MSSARAMPREVGFPTANLLRPCRRKERKNHAGENDDRVGLGGDAAGGRDGSDGAAWRPWLNAESITKKNRLAVGRISCLAELGVRPISTEPLHREIHMSKGAALFLKRPGVVMLLILCSATVQSRANFNGSDNFAGTTFSGNWGPSVTDGTGALSQNNQVVFTASGGTVDAWAVKPWTLNFGSYTQAWAVQIDTFRSDTISLTEHQSVCVGLIVVPTGATPGIASASFSAYLDYYVAVDPYKGFSADLVDPNGNFVGESSASSSTQSAAVRIAFDAATKKLTAFYDADGAIGGYSWTNFSTVNIAGVAAGSDWSSNWGMADANTFTVYLYDSSGVGDDHLLYSPSGTEMTLDNFQAIPEPATLSLLALGGLGMIRRRRK